MVPEPTLFLQLTGSQTARHMAVLCEAASKFAAKSTGQAVWKSPGKGADKPIAESVSVLDGCKESRRVEREWLQLCEAVWRCGRP